MKNTKNVVIVSGVIILSSLMVVSCGKNTKTNSQNGEENANANTIEYITVKDSCDTKQYESRIFLQYPIKGEKAYLDSVRMWIDTMLNSNVFAEKQTEFAVFGGDKNDAKAVAKYYMDNRKPSKDVVEEIKNNGFPMYGIWDSIYVSFLGENITTVSLFNYVNMGGAHGGAISVNNVFDNKTGKTYGWDMISDTIKLKSFIVKGLIKYFEVKTEKEMRDMLFDGSNILLPQAQPYFAQDGLHLIYQQYEIAPYSAGMPEIVIDWKDCKNVLTQEFFKKIANDVEKYQNKKQ